MRRQRAAGAIDRIHLRQCNFADVVIRLGPFPGLTVTHIRPLTLGVCSDKPKVAVGTQVFVGHSGRDNNHITATDRQADAILTAQLNFG